MSPRLWLNARGWDLQKEPSMKRWPWLEASVFALILVASLLSGVAGW